jgi:hypothetical protein
MASLRRVMALRNSLKVSKRDLKAETSAEVVVGCFLLPHTASFKN